MFNPLRIFQMRRELEARLAGAVALEAVARRERAIWEGRNLALNSRHEELQRRADDLARREQELVKEEQRLHEVEIFPLSQPDRVA